MAAALPPGVDECLNCIYKWRDDVRREYEERAPDDRPPIHELLGRHANKCNGRRPRVRILILQVEYHISFAQLEQRNDLHNAASNHYEDPKEGLFEVRKITGKQKPWDQYNKYEGKDKTGRADHEGNLPIHLAMHKGNWRIAQDLMDNHPKYENPSQPNAKDVDRCYMNMIPVTLSSMIHRTLCKANKLT